MAYYFFDVWVIPTMLVVGIIVWIGIKAVRKLNMPKVVLNERDRPIPDVVKDHPFTVNPILWVILVSSIFILIVIFYYWGSSSY
ncbi:hypothetical protein [Sporosarcina cyprini]|uniref:hypothetical protein n=1 Tax=Sporosarcina cyprini TaxID=2910523 RepID=UPI001EE15250|nr:hypothetical protein [Sporosarcina cyprini]MCG3087421.1 hypothetical protein [Sporosarcina cyprini]